MNFVDAVGAPWITDNDAPAKKPIVFTENFIGIINTTTSQKYIYKYAYLWNHNKGRIPLS